MNVSAQPYCIVRSRAYLGGCVHGYGVFTDGPPCGLQVLSSKLKISATPNFQFYHKGEKVFSFLGANPQKLKTHFERITLKVALKPTLKVDPEMGKLLPVDFTQVANHYDGNSSSEPMFKVA